MLKLDIMTESELGQIFGTLDSLIPLHEGEPSVFAVHTIKTKNFSSFPNDKCQNLQIFKGLLQKSRKLNKQTKSGYKFYNYGSMLHSLSK